MHRPVEMQALDALHEDPQRPVGHADHLVDDRRRADVVEIVEAGRLRLLVLDGDERQQPLAGDDVVDQLDRALLSDRERRHRLREDDRLLQRQHRQDRRQLRCLGDRLDESRRSRESPHLDHDPLAGPVGAAPAAGRSTGSLFVRRARLRDVDVRAERDLPAERARSRAPSAGTPARRSVDGCGSRGGRARRRRRTGRPCPDRCPAARRARSARPPCGSSPRAAGSRRAARRSAAPARGRRTAPGSRAATGRDSACLPPPASVPPS